MIQHKLYMQLLDFMQKIKAHCLGDLQKKSQ